MQFARDLEKLAITRLPNPQKRPGIEPPPHRPALIELFFERLADEVLFQPLPARILEDAGQPQQFLPVEPIQRIMRRGRHLVQYIRLLSTGALWRPLAPS